MGKNGPEPGLPPVPLPREFRWLRALPLATRQMTCKITNSVARLIKSNSKAIYLRYLSIMRKTRSPRPRPVLKYHVLVVKQ
jgi:hypothetical protein